MEAYKFIVKGRVQNVWYRKFVSQNAMKEGFKGYVKNLSDGSVEAVALFYDDEDMERFKNILKKGSPASSVKTIEVIPLKEDDLIYDGFEIRN